MGCEFTGFSIRFGIPASRLLQKWKMPADSRWSTPKRVLPTNALPAQSTG